METEIWKTIKTNPNYQISNFGRIKSKKQILKVSENLKGYPICRIDYKNKRTVVIHRLVAIYFIPNPENKPQVNHIDCNKKNNHYSNLEWCTNRENYDHARENGRIKFTENHLKALKLNNKVLFKKVIDISNGKIYESIVEAAKINNINNSTLGCYLRGSRTNKTTLRKYEW